MRSTFATPPARKTPPFPFLLLPHLWSSRNRARRTERGDLLRGMLFGGIGVGVFGALFGGAYWLTKQLCDYGDFGDFLLRLGLSWLFLTFLAFLAFSGVVTSLSTFFLADDLRVLLAAPVAAHRLFLARFTRTLGQASWMVVIFMTPVLLGVGAARCASPAFYITAMLVVAPFATIPVAVGAAATLVIVNVFPARRARDILMLTGLLFAASLVLVLRFIRPEQLLKVESLPDIADFFTSLQSPITPLLPSFWAGESLYASLQGGVDWLHGAALWSTALAFTIVLGAANERWHFSGYSRSQEAGKARVTQFKIVDLIASALPLSVVRRQLLLKDVKVFLRDVSQWLQLLPLLALVLLYLYNFSALDLGRVQFMSGVVKNVYAFLNLGLAGFVLATVAVRFVFPAVSAEGAAFWIIRTSPISFRDFLWSKFWTGLFPIAVLTEVLTIAANYLLGVDPFLKVVSAVSIILMSFALVGLATGLGARYPRFGADTNQVAGSYGGVAFMILAVLFIIVTIVLLGSSSALYLFKRLQQAPLTAGDQIRIGASFAAVFVLSIGTWLIGMRSGVRALEGMRD
jgi:ABC-2 type transport system permease protein